MQVREPIIVAGGQGKYVKMNLVFLMHSSCEMNFITGLGN